MKRRLVSFLLCIAMIFTGILATGCAGEGDDSLTTETGEDSGSALVRSGMTLTLWVPTESEMNEETEEALELVEEAINKITQSEFDTAIKIYAIPTDEYEEAVKKQMADITARVEAEEEAAAARRKAEREAAKNGETLPATEKTEIEEIENPYDLIVNSGASYPQVENNQMDIFLVRGYEDYQYYVKENLLMPLDEEINGTSKILKSYIYPSFFEAAKIDGITYAVPNNHALGEYKYLVVNKALADKYGKSQEDLANILYCENYINTVAANDEGVTPIWGEITPTYMQYWSGQDSDTFSVLSSYVTPSDTSTTQKKMEALNAVEFNNVFDISNFTDSIYYQKLYTEKGYISNAENVDNFAFAIVTATPEEIAAKYGENGEDYYINVYENPKGTIDDYCASMFAISKYTKDTARAMEIITYLNTETDMRTILQYGVENEHWKYDEADDSIIVQLSDVYKMNILDTGNIYMTYPNYGEPMDWSSEKTQNIASYYPVTYYMTNYVHESNQELITALDAFNVQILKEVEGMTASEFKSNLSLLRKKVNDNPDFNKLAYIPSSSDKSNNRTEENGYFADNSIAYMWTEVLETLAG